jgi:hypothetical protein
MLNPDSKCEFYLVELMKSLEFIYMYVMYALS